MKHHIHRAKHHLKNAFIPHAGNAYHPHAVRSHWLGIYAVLVIVVKLVTIGIVVLYSGPARVSDVTASNIISLTNQTRQTNGVTVLQTNAALNSAAQSKANNMLQEQYFAHVSPSNLSPWYWFKQAGYGYQYAGENLAIDFLEAEDVITAWLASPSHRANLLASKYQEIGVAVVTGNFQGAESILVVQMFGTPPPAPTTTPSPAPTQTPTVAQAEEEVSQPAPTPEPAPAPAPPPPPPPPAPVAPSTPTIATPGAGTVILTGLPTVVGQGEPASLVSLVVNESVVGTATVGDDGIYHLSPTESLDDGQYTLYVIAEARGLTSDPSATRTLTIDTAAPKIIEDGTFALFSILGADTYDVFVTTSDDAVSVECACGGAVTPLTPTAGRFVGQIKIGGRNSASTILSLAVSDEAGNKTDVALVDTDLFTTGVAAATDGPVTSSLRVLGYSRNFLIGFILIMLLLAVMKVVIVWERQHHPTTVGLLLVIYLAGSLLLL